VEYKKAIALNASDASAHNNLGSAYESKSDFDSAIREFREAKRLDPADLTFRANLAHTLTEQHMFA